MISINGGTGTIAGIAVGGLPDGTVDADTLAAQAVTPPKMSGAQTGNPPVFGIRAWVNLVGATGAINAQGNIATVIRTSTGSYNITFTTPMPDSNYIVNIGWGRAPNGNVQVGYISNVIPKDTTGFSVCFNAGGTAFDPSEVGITVIR